MSTQSKLDPSTTTGLGLLRLRACRPWLPSSRRAPVLAGVVVLLLLLVMYRSHHQSGYYSSYLGTDRLPSSSSSSLSSYTPAAPIPPIVHLVHLKPHDGAALAFSFQAFLCVYAALLHIRPATLFIHTDFNDTEVRHAREHGSPWTRKVLTAFDPDVVKLNPVTAPLEASPGGLPLERIEHKSDFVRMDQVGRHGGVYLDADVLTLRSPLPLMRAGFRAVVGRQGDNLINNGCFLAAPGAALVALMRRDMPAAFSGEWQQHSVALFTPLAERLAYVPGEVLIMDAQAFAPTGWWDESAAALYGEHVDENDEDKSAAVGVEKQVNVDTTDPFERWTNRTRGADWEMDFGPTYFLHAFKALWGPVPNFEGISVPYVLRRRSNYALAAWPIVMQGIKDGIIDENEESP